jgi:hypothetical protein
MPRTLNDFKSPKHKILAMLMTGRKKWKAKHHQVKKLLKLAENQVRAVTKSREKWRKRALEAERQLGNVQVDQKKTSHAK